MSGSLARTRALARGLIPRATTQNPDSNLFYRHLSEKRCRSERFIGQFSATPCATIGTRANLFHVRPHGNGPGATTKRTAARKGVSCAIAKESPMPRSGKGTRNRRTMAELATVKAVNARYSTHETAARIERAVFRATGERIASHTVFSAMGIRPVEGMASRGQWLTQRAMSEAASTGAPDDRTFPRGTAHVIAAVEPASKAGTATLRNKPIPQITLATLRRELRNATRKISEAELLIAKWEVDDSIIFLAIFIGIQDRYLATGDYPAFIREVDQLDLAREASADWARRMLADVQAGKATADRVRAAIEALRRNDVRNGRKPVTVADCALWDTHPVTPVKVTRAAPVTPTVAAPVADHAQEIMHGNKYFTRADA